MCSLSHHPRSPSCNIHISKSVMLQLPPASLVKNLGVLFDQTLGMKQRITHIIMSVSLHTTAEYQMPQTISDAIDTWHMPSLDPGWTTATPCQQGSLTTVVLSCNVYKTAQHVWYLIHANTTTVCPFKSASTGFKSSKLLLLTHRTTLHQCIGQAQTVEIIQTGVCQTPKARLKTYGDVAFSVAAPAEWNRLPEHIRSAPIIGLLKSDLKIFFIRYCF